MPIARAQTQAARAPAALPLLEVGGEFQLFEGEGHTGPTGRFQASGPWLERLEGVPFVSPHLPGLSRVRRRAVWVHRLQDFLGGRVGFVAELTKGRWRQDLLLGGAEPRVAWLRSWLSEGVVVVGGGHIRTKLLSPPLVYLVANGPHGDQRVVFPSLVGRLLAYAWMRPRTDELLVAVRSRARDWCDTEGLPAELWPDAVSGAVLSVLAEQRSEIEAETVLRASGQFPLPPA